MEKLTAQRKDWIITKSMALALESSGFQSLPSACYLILAKLLNFSNKSHFSHLLYERKYSSTCFLRLLWVLNNEVQVHCSAQKWALNLNVALPLLLAVVEMVLGNKTPLNKQFPKVHPVEQHSHEMHLTSVLWPKEFQEYLILCPVLEIHNSYVHSIRSCVLRLETQSKTRHVRSSYSWSLHDGGRR